MLSELQRRLDDLYRVDHGHDVNDYLITDPALARLIGRDAMITNTEETVLLRQDDDGLALSLFLDGNLLDRLNSADPLSRLRAEQLADLWTVLEGISHFVYIIGRASRDRSVTLLELEMQAEVDKFVSTILLAIDQGDNDLVNHMHGWLFDSVGFRSELDPDQYERYRAANDYASRFCHALRQGLIEGRDIVLEELRRFYHLSQTQKISHIHSLAWASS